MPSSLLTAVELQMLDDVSAEVEQVAKHTLATSGLCVEWRLNSAPRNCFPLTPIT
jgi:hypothetical protein